jgi:hypothetical protein
LTISRLIAGMLAALVAVPALGQATSTTTTTTTPLPAPTPPPAAAPAPAQQAPSAQQPPPGASQQVVVNPPAAAPAPAPQAPAPSSVVVTPPPAPPPRAVVVDRGERRSSTVIVDDRPRRRSPMATIATNALYGGAAGAILGTGVALIEQDNYVRDIMIGAGVGVIAGGIVGGVMAYGDEAYDRVAVDGLGTPEREKDRQRPMTKVAAYTLRW